MQYTVSSRGRSIGVTDLGFVRLGGPSRMGWFHENEYGERVIPLIASPIAALRPNYRHSAYEEETKSILPPHMNDDAAFADMAEAAQLEEALDFKLHREDGSVVLTESIGFRDTEELIALANLADERRDDEEYELVDEASEAELAEAIEHDAKLLAEDFDELRAWTPEDDEPPNFPRYQIQVLLIDDDAIL